VFILEHFISKSFAAVRETFSSVYPHKKLSNKTTIHRRSAREYTMFAPAQFCATGVSSGLATRVTLTRASTVGFRRIYYTWVDLLLISFLCCSSDSFGGAFQMVHPVYKSRV
jgi:hypothetical protein